MNVKKLKQPSVEEQVLQDGIVNNRYDIVELPNGKKYKVRWTRNSMERYVTHLILEAEKYGKDKDGNEESNGVILEKAKRDDSKIICKAASYIILNSFIKIKLLHWFLWRWFYYVKEYTANDLYPIIETAKKKIPQEKYYLATISLIGMKDTMMTMRTAEVQRFLQEQNTGQRTH